MSGCPDECSPSALFAIAVVVGLAAWAAYAATRRRPTRIVEPGAGDPCACSVVDPALQLFRIRRPEQHFEAVADAGPATAEMIGGRWVWRCRRCGAWFALLRIPFKDEVDILVRAPSPDWRRWDWNLLAELAGRCTWRGLAYEERHVL